MEYLFEGCDIRSEYYFVNVEKTKINDKDQLDLTKRAKIDGFMNRVRF